MGRILQALVRQGVRRDVFIVIALLALWSTTAAEAQDDNSIVELRNGFVPLRKASEVSSAVAAAVAAEAAGGNSNGGGGAGGPPANVPHGRDKDGRKLILLRYSEDTVRDMRANILRAGASILEYVAYNTLLVLAKSDAISVAARYNALAAEYTPAFKVAPEASAVFTAAAAKAAEMQMKNRRRGLAASNSRSNSSSSGGGGNGGGGSSAGGGSKAGGGSSADANTIASDSSGNDSGNGGGNGNNVAGPAASNNAGKGIRGSAGGSSSPTDDDAADEVNSQSSFSVLRGLNTWRLYNKLFQPTDNNTTQPLPPPPGADGNGSAIVVPELYAVTVRLTPTLSDKARRTIAQAWPAALADALGRAGAGDKCRPQAASDGLYSQASPILLVYFCLQDYEQGVTWLTRLDTVVWVEPSLKPAARNAAAGWIMQTGSLSMDTYISPTSGLRPYWAANLQGQGVIVGLEDSGLDMSHCNFIDDRWRTGSLRTLFVGSPPRLYLPYHRKVVQYMLPINSGINRWFGDEPYGHGTHAAGSIAGAAFASKNGSLINHRGTGSAPQARLSFFDISPSNGIFVPMPLDDKVLPYHYGAGARISSSSWGYSGALAVSYNEACRQFDAFAWRNPDFLTVIAAGNDGDNGFMATVTAPGTAKNVLSVGATINHPAGFSASPYNMAILFRYRDANNTLKSYSMWPYLGKSDYYWRMLLDNQEVPFRVASPLNACTNLTGNYTGAVVLVDLTGTSCTADQRAINARRAGAAAVMFIAAGTGFLDYSQEVIPRISDFNTIYGLISRAEGLNTVALLSNSSLVITNPHMTFLYYPNVDMGINSLPYFSSYGPFTDGRIKPDIVAPGAAVESAASGPGIRPDANSSTCSSSTIQLQGTSMSTPLVAGHLALARQYFRDGYYPLGISQDPASVGFEPSGMLLKAAAIAGASSMTGGFAGNGGFTLGQAPDGYQGWGRFDLSRMLPLPNLTHPLFRVAVADFGVVDQGEWIYLHGLVATGTGPIVAALVWHDYPSSPAAKKNLVNDLDFGYMINTTSYIRTRTDNTNNVERVELSTRDVRAGDRVSLVVYGRNLRSYLLSGADAELPQRWAVMVAGHFNGTLRTPLNPAYTRPQRFLLDTQVFMRLRGSRCVYSRTDLSILTGGCTTSSANLTLVEEPAPAGDPRIGPTLLSDSGWLYTIRDVWGRCITVPGNISGTRAIMATCNATDARQKFGLFLGHPADGPLYFVVPSFAINATGVSPRCLRQNSASFVVLMPCTDDDLDQRFEIRSFTAGRPPRMLPPSPPPPTPSPNAPPQQWYPYSLVFRTDWYPIGGSVNLNDYDYMAGHNGYGDYSYGVPLDDLDIMASWTWNGATYTMGRWAQNADNISATTGAEYGGDNTKYGTQYEIVYFPAGVSPPPTDFYVCVAWTRTQTSTTRVVLTMYKGYAVASTTKVFNTTRQSDYSCTPSSAGYVGSFNPSAPSPPPPPPSPTIVQQSYPYPLLLRTDWTIISGVRGRSSKPYDFDILVSWTEGNTTFMVGSVALTAGRAVYGGDNLRNNGTNYEYVYWPAGASLPATNTLHVCVRWNGNPKPLARVMLSVYHGTRFTTSTTMVDTTFDWSETCVPGAIGYIDSYWLGQARSLLDDLGYSNCYTPPVPSSATSLYFLVQWTPANSTSPGPTLFDWDLVVTWSYGGAAYEISPYLRFVASAVHGGDNMRVSVPGNSEAVYWPTGLTGMEPSPTQYDVCVRWYTRGRLNVTLTVFLYTNPVLRVTKTLESVAVNSKTCSQYAVGYVGSYNYTGGSAPVSAIKRRATEVLFEGDASAPAGTAEGGFSGAEDVAHLVP